MLRTTEPPFPPSLISAYGFHSDERLPISAFQATKPKLAMKVIGDVDPRTLDEESLAAGASSFWSLKF